MTDEHLNMQRNACLKNVFTRNKRSVRTIVQAPVVQRLDNAIQWINRYPADKC